MLKTIVVLGVLCAPAGVLSAQTAPEKPVYTFIAEYGVPRANWAEFTARWEKQSRPILERLLGDGTLLEFGATANVVHAQDGNTHAFWWSSMTMAGTQRVLAELANIAPVAPVPGMTHRDRLVRSVVYRARAGRLTSGFSEYSVAYVKPGKSEEWRTMYDKYTKPVYERLFEQGTILGYGVDAEQVHTDKAGARFSWVLYPDAEAIDKTYSAFAAERQKTGADERKAAMAAFSEITDTDAHRDGLDRVLFWAHK